MPRTAKKTTKDKDTTAKRSPKVKSINRLRGMKDVLLDEFSYFDLVQKKARELASSYGFSQVIIPILENAALYDKATGKSTDIVSKEMYVFTDKSGEKVAIRPEITPGLVRAYIEHGMFNLPQPVKMFTLGPVFRHEKPQSGRYRQHHQFDLEIFGEESPVADAQVMLIAYNFFKELQLSVQTQVNSIGCSECRPDYIKKLVNFYKERGKRSKLCNDCKKRLTTNPLRLLDCKEEECIAVREDAPQIVDSLCEPCRDHFIKVLEYLDELEVPYNLNPYLVRGLDYYNRTVFELWSEEDTDTDAPKRQSSLGGGGRYDTLVELMGGRPTPALGFGIGMERAILKIKELNIPLSKDTSNIVYFAQLGDQAKRKAMVIFEELRRAGYAVRQSFTKDSLKNQLEDANRIGARYSLILGQKELSDGTLLLRDMEAGVQEVIDIKKVVTELEKRLRPNGETVK